MKTLILYATKHGAAKEIAERISKQLGNAKFYDLKEDGKPQLLGFDCIIIGSSVYAGSFRKEAKSYLTEHADDFKNKKLGLFISGISESDGEDVFKSNVPTEVLQSVKAKAALGGIFDPKKSGFFGRLIMKIVTKKTEYINTISDEKINSFVEALKS